MKGAGGRGFPKRPKWSNDLGLYLIYKALVDELLTINKVIIYFYL